MGYHKIKVHVTPQGALPPGGGNVPCDITAVGNVGGGRVEDNHIILNATEGPFCIRFVLNHAGLNWDVNDPFWVSANSCPTGPSSVSEQVWVNPSIQNKTLTILNMNVDQRAELHYRLNFLNGYSCDPIMDNGGGNNFS